MAGRGRGRGRGLLAATSPIKPQLNADEGAHGDSLVSEVLHNDNENMSATTTTSSLPSKSSGSFEGTATRGSFTSSSSTAPMISTSMATGTSSSPAAKQSFPLSSSTSTTPSSRHRTSSSVVTKNTGILLSLEESLNRLCGYDEDKEVSEIINVMKSSMVSADSLKKSSEMLYQKCVSDVNIAKAGAVICNSLASIEMENTKFRSCILSYLQKDFEERDNLCRESFKFVGFFTFLCQIFGEMRTATGEHFRPLIAPIFSCVDMMLGVADGGVKKDHSDNPDEIECILLQFQSIGKELDNLDAEKMMKTMESVRMKIINNGTSPQIRCILLELVECYGRKFEQAPNEVTRFYCETMAEILAGLVI